MIRDEDYDYFGVQNGDGCYCGNDDSKFIPVPKGECNKPCTGNPSEICGDSWRLSVYGPRSITPQFKSTTTSTTILSSTTSATTTSTTTIPVTTDDFTINDITANYFYDD